MLYILLIGLCLIISPLPLLAQNTNTILIIPFDVQADAKYDFLKPAIADMLFTRLSAPGRTLVLGRQEEHAGISRAEAIGLADAIQVGQQNEANYVVTGSIILQEDNISTHADFIGIAEQRVLIAFAQNGTQPGDIIGQIGNFTAQVNADIFNPGASSDEQTSQSDVPDNIYQHPEKLTIPETPAKNPAGNKPTQVKKRPSLQPIDNR